MGSGVGGGGGGRCGRCDEIAGDNVTQIANSKIGLGGLFIRSHGCYRLGRSKCLLLFPRNMLMDEYLTGHQNLIFSLWGGGKVTVVALRGRCKAESVAPSALRSAHGFLGGMLAAVCLRDEFEVGRLAAKPALGFVAVFGAVGKDHG